MIRATIEQNRLEIDAVANRAQKGVKAGIADGVRLGAVALSKDVAAHTPSRSGKARLSVIAEAHHYIENGQVVKYDYREAFYMRFVLRGAKPHRIYNKYISTRGLRQAKRRAEKSGDAGPSGPKGALSFMFGGALRAFSEVQHPGIRGRDILGQRLAANKSTLIQTIYASIERSMSKRR